MASSSKDGDSKSNRLDVEVQICGNMWKMATSGRKRWAYRFCVIKDGFLLYYKSRTSKILSFDVHPKGVFPLGGCVIVRQAIGPNSSTQCGLTISNKSYYGNRQLTLSTDNMDTIDEWQRAIEISRHITHKNAISGSRKIDGLMAVNAELVRENELLQAKLESAEKGEKSASTKALGTESVVVKSMLESRRLRAELAALKMELESIKHVHGITNGGGTHTHDREVKGSSVKGVRLKRASAPVTDLAPPSGGMSALTLSIASDAAHGDPPKVTATKFRRATMGVGGRGPPPPPPPPPSPIVPSGGSGLMLGRLEPIADEGDGTDDGTDDDDDEDEDDSDSGESVDPDTEGRTTA